MTSFNSYRADLIRRLDDALSFGTTGRNALPNLLKDCKSALEQLDGPKESPDSVSVPREAGPGMSALTEGK